MGREAEMKMAKLLPLKNMDNKRVLFQNYFHGPIFKSFFFLLFFFIKGQGENLLFPVSFPGQQKHIKGGLVLKERSCY